MEVCNLNFQFREVGYHKSWDIKMWRGGYRSSSTIDNDVKVGRLILNQSSFHFFKHYSSTDISC